MTKYTIQFKQGKNLYSATMLLNQDAFIKFITFKGNKEVKGKGFKTFTAKGGGSKPVWNQSFDLELDDLKDVVFVLHVEHEGIMSNDLIGKARINAKDLLDSGKEGKWFRIGRNAGLKKDAGHILISSQSHSLECKPNKLEEGKKQPIVSNPIVNTTIQPVQQKRKPIVSNPVVSQKKVFGQKNNVQYPSLKPIIQEPVVVNNFNPNNNLAYNPNSGGIYNPNVSYNPQYTNAEAEVEGQVEGQTKQPTIKVTIKKSNNSGYPGVKNNNNNSVKNNNNSGYPGMIKKKQVDNYPSMVPQRNVQSYPSMVPKRNLNYSRMTPKVNVQANYPVMINQHQNYAQNLVNRANHYPGNVGFKLSFSNKPSRGNVVHVNKNHHYSVSHQNNGVDTGIYFIKNAHGKYLGAKPSKKGVYAVGHAKGWEKLTIGKDGSKYTLKDSHGNYIGVSPKGDPYQVGHCKAWEKYTIEKCNDGKVAFKDAHGKYLGMSPNNNFYTVGHLKGWEKFSLQKCNW